MNIQETLALEDELLQKYGNGEADKEAIKALCLATNVAEIVKKHYKNTNNKSEFYRTILNDDTLEFSLGYEILNKHFAYLK